VLGDNDFGQIGNGWTRYYTQPVKVVDSLATWNIYLPLMLKP
jgi:hypothetical protein